MWNWEHVSQLTSFSRGMKLSLYYRVKFLLSCFTSVPGILFYFVCSGLASEGRMSSASFQPILWREDEQFPGRLKMYFRIFSSWRRNWAEVSHSLMKCYNRLNVIQEKGCLVYFLFSKRVLCTECNSDIDGMLLANSEHTFLIQPFTRQKCRSKMWRPLGLSSHAAKQSKVPLWM